MVPSLVVSVLVTFSPMDLRAFWQAWVTSSILASGMTSFLSRQTPSSGM